MRKWPLHIYIYGLIFLTCSCTHLYMQPDRVDYALLWLDREDFTTDHFFKTKDGVELHGWSMRDPEIKEKPKALVVQFHGNAQNLSAHYHSVIWLVEHNFQVFSFDYRGYGMSEGAEEIFKSMNDIEAGIAYAANLAEQQKIPLIFYGQSLGGSLLLKYLKENPKKWQPSLVIIESSFYSYQGLARDKLASSPITWPLQWLAYLTVSSELDPGGKDLAKLKHIPTLLIYSERDAIVPIEEGLKLFGDLDGKKEFWTYPQVGHSSYYRIEDGVHQQKLADYIKKKL